jgi:capsular polysaccharide transport system permease protein
LGLSWAIVNPIAFIFILSFLRGRLDGGETHGMPTFVFMAHGMLMIQLFLTMFNSLVRVVKKAAPLYAFRQVQPISPVLAASMFQVVLEVFIVLGVCILMFLLSIELRMDNFLLFASNFASLVVFTFAIGLLFGLATCFVPEILKLQQILTRPLFFISGVFFSMKDVPQEYWWLFDWNPILHTIELNRYAAYSSYGSEGVDYNYLLLVTLFTLCISFLFYRSSWKAGISR